MKEQDEKYFSKYDINDFFCFSDGKTKNKSEEQTAKQINSNPANCNDIGILGYTLNGFYIVNGKNSAGRFGVVFCQFKLPSEGGNKSKGTLLNNIILDDFLYLSWARLGKYLHLLIYS